MKVILSRKGCDSDFGGIPGIILPNHDIVYVPIPGEEFETISYHDIKNRGTNLMDIIKQVSPHIKLYEEKRLIDSTTKCHLDPDLDYEYYPRNAGWRGCFGQADAAQTVLEHAKIEPGDLFLFFGWFRHTYEKEEKLCYAKEQGIHMIFGWLQIEKMIYTYKDEVPGWLNYHPHAIKRRLDRKSNCIFIGREHLSWNENIKGYGIFPKAEDALILTKKGMSRSKWSLPEEFKEVSLTYHKPTSWKEDYFQSACRGQKFVFEESSIVSDWACKIIEENQ